MCETEGSFRERDCDLNQCSPLILGVIVCTQWYNNV